MNNLSAQDLKASGPRVLTVKAATEEVLKDQKTNKEQVRLRLQFLEERRGLILNKGNAAFMVALAGDDYSKWLGTRVEVFFDPTARGFAGAFGGTAIRKPTDK